MNDQRLDKLEESVQELALAQRELVVTIKQHTEVLVDNKKQQEKLHQLEMRVASNEKNWKLVAGIGSTILLPIAFIVIKGLLT
jgi:hypothetical protein